MINSRELLLAFGFAFTVSAESLDEWSQRGTREQGFIMDVTYGEGLFVTAGAQVLNSFDGLQWWVAAPDFPLTRITYQNGRFAGLHSDRTISTSDDGTNWLRRTFGTTAGIYGFGSGGGLFLMTGTGGNLWTSDDAVNWQKRDSGTNVALGHISYANGRYFVSGWDSQFSLISSNAVDWKPVTTRTQLRSVAYGAGVYVASAGGAVAASTNGLVWSSSDYSGPPTWVAAFAAGNFVLGARGPSIWTSRDGTTWISRPIPQASTGNMDVLGIASNDRCIVASAPSGSTEAAYLIRSTDLKAATTPIVELNLFAGVIINGSPGFAYRVEATSDMVNTNVWMQIATVVLSKPRQIWFDESSPLKPRRFYRAAIAP